MSTYILHDRLLSRHKVTGRLAVKSPLRISSGEAGPDTDAPFVRDSAGRVYIPASSLRGAVRAALERLVNGVGADVSGINACCLLTDQDCAAVHRQKVSEINEEPDEEQRRLQMTDLIENKLCDLCRLFGNTMFASRLFFEDCPLAADARRHLVVRDGVGIDRDSGAAAAAIKYDYEVLDPGNSELEFSFSVTVENASATDKRIVAAMLQLLIEGIHVGGKRSGGMGLVQLKKGDIRVTGFQSPQALWDAVVGNRSPDSTLAEGEEGWKEVFAC